MSDVVVCSTGAPQGMVLFHFLFTLYTLYTHQTSDNSCHLQKFCDDTALISCVSQGDNLEYMEVIANFVDWCGRNHLDISASKTKEMVVDFHERLRLQQSY